MNDEGLYGYGQLGGLLRARFCDTKIHGINKTDGLTLEGEGNSRSRQTIVIRRNAQTLMNRQPNIE